MSVDMKIISLLRRTLKKRRKVHYISSKKELFYLDEELFRNDRKPLKYYPYGLNGHFNELGYELIAKFIKEKINEN